MNFIAYHEKIELNLQRWNRLSFILILTTTLFIIKGTTDILFNFFESTGILKNIEWISPPSVDSENVYILFIGAVLFAPLAETLINQSLPYLLFEKVPYFSNKKWLVIVISALFFGLKHIYSLYYVIYGCIGGFVLMYAYMVRIERDKGTFFLLAISHSIFNLIILITQIYL
jgi:hypothetical protein